jgi:hypothetical protein
MTGHLFTKWKEVEMRKRVFAKYGDNANVAIRTNDIRTGKGEAISFAHLFNKTFPIKQIDWEAFPYYTMGNGPRTKNTRGTSKTGSRKGRTGPAARTRYRSIPY